MACLATWAVSFPWVVLSSVWLGPQWKDDSSGSNPSVCVGPDKDGTALQ